MQLKILDVIQQVPEVRTLRFERPEGFSFRPGQFVLIAQEVNGQVKKRAYSIASSPTEPCIDITLKRVQGGQVSPLLYEKKPGEVLEVKGPYGRFYLDEEHMDNIVLVAGGTGITPARSIIKYLVDKKLDHVKVSLFQGARNPEELIYHQEFEHIHHEHHNIGIYFTVDAAEGAYWPWQQGHITVDFIKSCAHQLVEPIYYLCGPPRMVENLMHDLEEAGVPPQHIHTDRW